MKMSMSTPSPKPMSVNVIDAAMNPECSPRSSVANSLCRQELDEHYTVLRELGSGTYGRVVLARCRKTGAEVALKMLARQTTKLKDFLREFNYSYYLSPHRAVLNTFDVAFETSTAYVFAQEHAPVGDLFEAITPQVGLPDTQVKTVARQIGSALEFMHSRGLVHRDVKPENVLIFDDRLSRVKLMDFGMTKRSGTLVRKVSHGIPYTPPEICAAARGERYTVDSGADVWAFGVLLFCALTGNFPWELAHHDDCYFAEFARWQKRRTSAVSAATGGKTTPAQWRRFSARLMRLFRRMLDPKPQRRCAVREIFKYAEETAAWVVEPPTINSFRTKAEEAAGDDSPAVHHVTKDPMADLNAMLEEHGIDTKVNRRLRDRRISEWIMTQFVAA